jgi:hypothetical protein
MGLRNLTIKGKTDGFGCQLNAKLSGIAFCFHNHRYRYVHTPFKAASHGWGSAKNTKRINDFLGIPFKSVRRANVSHRYMTKVFKNPDNFYTHGVLDHLRDMFWSNKEYEVLEQITVHIRRGDIQSHRRDGGRYKRHQDNGWYTRIIPKIASYYPDSYPIVIHSEGNMEEFQSIKDGCPDSISERMIFKLGIESNEDAAGCKHDMLSAFYEMIASKVLVQSKSGLSYCAGIFNAYNVHIPGGNRAMGQSKHLRHWDRI